MQFTRRAFFAALCLTAAGLCTQAQAKPATRALYGKIILSTQPFPMSFASKKKMVKALKKLHTTKLMYNEEGFIDVEFMGFFRRQQIATEFTATLYDITEKRVLLDNFPIYPSQRKTQILASGMRFKLEQMEPMRNYHLTMTTTFGGPVLAEVEFTIADNPKHPFVKKAVEP